MSRPDADRRRYQRIALARADVRVQVAGKDLGYVTDISYGGVGVSFDGAAELPAKLVVTLTSGSRRMKIPVVVARSAGRSAGLALDVVRLSPQGRAFMDALLVEAVRPQP